MFTSPDRREGNIQISNQEESSLAPVIVKRKRGRPPKHPALNTTGTPLTVSKTVPAISTTQSSHEDKKSSLRRNKSNDSLDNSDIESSNYNRKRARGNSIDSTEYNLTGTPSLLSRRRSHRGRTIDVSRDVVVFRNDSQSMDEIKELFDLKCDADIEQFQLMLSESVVYYDSDCDDHHSVQSVNTIPNTPKGLSNTTIIEKTEVFIPSVKEIDDIETKKSMRDNTRRYLQKGYQKHQFEAYDETYLDYDANSDDEHFLEDTINQLSSLKSSDSDQSSSTIGKRRVADNKSINKKFYNELITNRLLEEAINILEKSVEMIRNIGNSILDVEKSHLNSVNAMSRSREMRSRIKLFMENGRNLHLLENFGSDSSSFTVGNIFERSEGSNIYDAENGSHKSSNIKKPYKTSSSIHSSCNSINTTSTRTNLYNKFSYKRLNDIITEDIGIASILPMIRAKFQEICKTTAQEKFDPDVVDEICTKLARIFYGHWITNLRQNTTSGFHEDSKFSLLRGYHKYMMKLWEKPDSVLQPQANNYNEQILIQSYEELNLRRKELDRARLIVDRVRRREKIKKEILRINSDLLDENLSPLYSLFHTNTSSATIIDGSNINPPIVRKRGRPRRSDSVSSQTSSTSVAQVKKLIPTSIPENTAVVSATIPKAAVKFVQGRDKFGKFMKKGVEQAPLDSNSHIRNVSEPFRNTSHSTTMASSTTSEYIDDRNKTTETNIQRKLEEMISSMRNIFDDEEQLQFYNYDESDLDSDVSSEEE